MKKSLVVVLGAVLASVSCGKDVGPTGGSTPVVATQDPTIPAPNQPVGQPALGTSTSIAYDVAWGDRASWAVSNPTSDTLYYTAQWTDFDNQSLVRGSQDLNAAPGTVSQGTFNRGCVQVDLLAGGAIFNAAFFGKDGRQFNPGTSPGKVDECRPKPTPAPTPTPCVNEVSYTYTDTHFEVTSLSDPGNSYGIYKGDVRKSAEFSQSQLPFNFNYANNGDELCVKFRHPAVQGSAAAYYYEMHDDGQSDLGGSTKCVADGGTFLGNSTAYGQHVCKTATNHGDWWNYVFLLRWAQLKHTDDAVQAKSESFENVAGTCTQAKCAEVQAGWHGTMQFVCTPVRHDSCEN